MTNRMKIDFNKSSIIRCLIIVLTCMTPLVSFAQTGSICGNIIDKEFNEPLIGAAAMVKEASIGAVADLDGNYRIDNLPPGEYTILFSYVAYRTSEAKAIVQAGQETRLDVVLQEDVLALKDIVITARKNTSNERTLLLERKTSKIAVENLGSKEMGIKGISNVQEGVKKITGISVASAGQLVVRGLGDRYSTTTLNGLPIASPNPDNKLIPLDLFPSSIVNNITVSKVFQSTTFADYSGAHINISTKEKTGKDFFSLALKMGAYANTAFGDFYRMDKKGSLFTTPSLAAPLRDHRTSIPYITKNADAFGSTFKTNKLIAIPDFGITLASGKSWRFENNNELNFIASMGISNENKTLKDAYFTTLEATGNTSSHFDYDSYSAELKMNGLFTLGYQFRESDRISYTLFYARNATDTYMHRRGYNLDFENLVGSSSISHIYSLLNNQLLGSHTFGRFTVDWAGSYGKTRSDEPDRRDMLFTQKEDGSLKLFTSNGNAVFRYFGELKEQESIGDLKLTYDHNNLLFRVGGTYRDKMRDFYSTRFYYNYQGYYPVVPDEYDTDPYFNHNSIVNGDIQVSHDAQPRNCYDASHRIASAYFDLDYHPIQALLVSIGLRYEHSKEYVHYWNDGGSEKHRDYTTDDLFPALNLKYTLNEQNTFRLSASRTVTRPSFIEMAPFLYQESLGADAIRGNADLKNGYNYNLDFRYEWFASNDTQDMISATIYYKKLDSPIERVQQTSGGAAVHTFQNTDEGQATGLEIEANKGIIKDLKVGMNASLMYTNITLPEGGGNYTESSRGLQGASPYLGNADITYSPLIDEKKQRRLSLSLLYNLQGPRIYSVGIEGAGDIKQRTLHTIDFAGSIDINHHLSLKAQVKDMMNTSIRFEQEIKNTGEVVEVRSFKPGLRAELGVTYNF